LAARAAVFTVSDSAAGGRRADRSGPALADFLRTRLGADVVEQKVLPDEPRKISEAVTKACSSGISLVVLTGGTGVAPRDRTPEAVRQVVEFEIPGLAEKMRAETGKEFPAAFLSRQVIGARGSSLILALPGSPKGALDCLAAVAALVPHALELLSGERPAHPRHPDKS
jgi:molybdopterin adenylyltransferase